MQLDSEDSGGFNNISGLDDLGGTSLSTQPQGGLGALTPPEPKVNELLYDPTLINETVQQPKFGGSYENLFPSTPAPLSTPQFNFNGDPLYGSDPVGFDPNNLGFVADQATPNQTVPNTSTIGNPFASFGALDLNAPFKLPYNPTVSPPTTPEEQKQFDDYWAANPIDLGPNFMRNTFAPGFDLRLNSPEEQIRLNNLDKIIDPLTQQILGQNLTDKWTGQGYGSPEANARDMAKLLNTAGITDINQFGKVDKYEAVSEIGKSYNGNRVYQTGPDDYGNGGGEYYYREPTNEVDYEGNTVYRTVMVPRGAKLDTQYGFAQDNGEGGTNYSPVDSSKVVMRNGVPTAATGKTWGNKETGQAIESRTGRWQRQGGEDLFGGTGEGKGNTGYRVYMGEDGKPYFYTTQGSSSDLQDIAPILAIAQFIPGLAPFATAANAAIAASQGNFLGAIAGAAGLGGFTDVANAANFAGAVKSGNPLSIISAGAGLGGTDLSGVADAAGLGDLNNIGGFNVSDAAKAYRAVKAIESGDPSAIISAVGGYMQDQQNQRPSPPSSPLDSLVPIPSDGSSTFSSLEEPTDRSIATRPIESSIDDEIDQIDIPSIGGDPMDLILDLPRTPAANQTQDLSGKSFGSAFAQARASGAKEFLWNDNVYNTNLAPKQTTAAYDSVGGGRGGQGGPTAQELARANAVRGNPPQSEFANWASSVFPSAQAGSVPSVKAPDMASQIPGQSYTAPASTYDQNNSMFGRVADELGLPQEFQRNVSNTLNALPGLNLPVGAAGRAVGAVDELGASKYLDEAGRYVPGSNAYKAPEYASEATRLTADPMKMFKMIQDLPNDVYQTSAVQNALKAISNGDGVAAFKALESNPYAKRALLDYAERMGAQEVSAFKNINLYNPPKYTQRLGGGYSQKTGKKAEGGLASINQLGGQ
jgi:hypothetical protein